jgi:hypothetical protein
MAEAEWLAAIDPTPMLESLGTSTSNRKLRLFCCASCLRAAHLLTEDYVRYARKALAVFEQHLEGLASDQELQTAWGGVFGDVMDAGAAVAHPGEADYYAISAAASAVDNTRRDQVASATAYAASAVAYDSLARSGNPTLSRIASEWTPTTRPPGYSRERWARDEEEMRRLPEYVQALAAEQRAQCVLLRDIFGNPGRATSIKREWLTSDVVALASSIYQEKAFDWMPILADALQDAGCENDDILSHCRDAKQVHVRGCRVVDLVLGKE